MQNLESESSILIITGMHRSGTSLTASLLQSAGLDIGDRLMGGSHGNVKGHFEDKDFVGFHERVLRSQGISPEGWTLNKGIQVQEQYLNQAKSLIQTRSAKKKWGWKDPRTTLFLDFWAELIPQAKFLFVYRLPWEVIDSLYRRGDQVFFNNPNFALDVWINYNRAIADFIERFSEKCILLNIDSITNDPNHLIKILDQSLGISFKSVGNVYDKSQFHSEVSSSHRPTLLKHYFPEAFDLYNELNYKAKLGESSSSSFLTDENTKFPPYKVWVLQDWLNVRKLERELKESQGQRQETQTELEASQAQLQQTQTELEASQAQLQQTQTEWEKTQHLLQQAQEGWGEAQTIVKAMETSKFWKLRRVWFKLKRTIGLRAD